MKVKKTVDMVCDKTNRNPNQMQFLIENAELVYFARRALSWMYAGRHYCSE